MIFNLAWLMTISTQQIHLSYNNLTMYVNIHHQNNGFIKYITKGLFTGLWLHESGVLGATPDAVILSPPKTLLYHLQTSAATNKEPSILEIKCPYVAREMSVEQAASTIKNVYICKLCHESVYVNVM